MKKIWDKMKNGLQRFLYGRYGYDELSLFISVTAFVIILFACLVPKAEILSIAAFLLLIWTWFRTLSKNHAKRRSEREKYLALRNGITQKFRLAKNKWQDRKTHRYYKCPNCKAALRITKPGRHKTIGINCPKCKTQFTRRT